jgi:hypothetical protein
LSMDKIWTVCTLVERAAPSRKGIDESWRPKSYNH